MGKKISFTKEEKGFGVGNNIYKLIAHPTNKDIIEWNSGLIALTLFYPLNHKDLSK